MSLELGLIKSIKLQEKYKKIKDLWIILFIKYGP